MRLLTVYESTPDYDLNVMKKGKNLVQIMNRILEGLDKIFQKEAPHIVLVHGDTSTTFTASLAAYYNQIAIGHVEAGLRTWDKYSPYPEEMNRQLTGVLADMHFAPTEQSKQNLIQENKQLEHIYVTGNTVIDALQTTVQHSYTHPILEQIGDQRLILMTAHRRENVGQKMDHMFRAIKRLVETHDDIHVV